MIRLIITAAAALVVSGCSSDTRTPIVVYSPHGKEMLAEFERLYEQAHPTHDVQWLDMGSQDAYDRVRTERDNPQADIWWGAPVTAFAQAEAEGLLERYVPSWDSVVSAEFKSASGCWYGTFITPEVIMYNTRMLKESDVPRDWDGLLDSRWRGRIVIRYPLASGTMRIIFSALIQREIARTGDSLAGFAWLRRLDANTKTYVPDPTQLYLSIARGEAVLSVWNLPDVALQAQVHQYPFGYVMPASGTPLITDCIALVRGSQHPEEAKSFYEFVTSRESMKLQADRFFRIPARRDIPASELPSWLRQLSIIPMNVTWPEVSAREKEWMRYWDERIKGTGHTTVGAN